MRHDSLTVTRKEKMENNDFVNTFHYSICNVDTTCQLFHPKPSSLSARLALGEVRKQGQPWNQDIVIESFQAPNHGWE